MNVLQWMSAQVRLTALALVAAAGLLSSSAEAAAPGLHLITAQDVSPSTAPLLASKAAAMPLRLAADLEAPAVPLPTPAMPPLDDGGGASVRGDALPVLAILLSALIGFGLGHLVARDRDGFVLFLIVDLVICVVFGTVGYITPFFWLGFGGLGPLALLISHIVQVVDVYPRVMGSRLVQRATDGAVVIASGGREGFLPASRVFGFAF